jgi:hypothetical protein
MTADLDMHRLLTDIAFDIDIQGGEAVSASLKERANLLLERHKNEQALHRSGRYTRIS